MAKNVIINGVTYNEVPFVVIPQTGGGDAQFFDTTDATGVSGDLLSGKSMYGASGKISGGMASNGDTSGTIATKEGTVSIPAGHTSGGTVSVPGRLPSAEQLRSAGRIRPSERGAGAARSAGSPFRGRPVRISRF